MKDSIVTGSKQHNHKMENKESLFECVNKLNNIQLKINKPLLDYLNTLPLLFHIKRIILLNNYDIMIVLAPHYIIFKILSKGED